MKKLKKAALLQDYQDKLVRYINNNPEAIYNLNWCKLTNGFDSDIVKYLVMNLSHENAMEQLILHLKAEWKWWSYNPEPSMFSDEKRGLLKYGSEANPIHFDVYMDELKRLWQKVNC